MVWFHNLSMRRKLAVGFGTLQIVMIGLGIFSLVRLARVNSAVVEVVTDRVPSIQALGGLKYDTSSVRRAELSYLLAVDGKEKWDASMRQAMDNIPRHENEYQGLIGSERERAGYDRFHKAWENYLSVHQQVMALTRDNEYQAGVLAQSAGNSAFEDAAKAPQDEVDLENQTTAEAGEKATTIYLSSRYWITGLLACTVIAGVVMSASIGHTISAAFYRMLAQMEQIAAKNLAIEDIEVGSDDEVGKAGCALNAMKSNLKEVIGVIAGTAERMASTSAEISSSAVLQSHTADAQKDQTTQVATAMQQMSATVQEVSENSTKAAEASRLAAETARQGGDIVEEVLHRMRLIADSVQGSAQKMEQLGKSSRQIGSIAGVIDDIADQTNLLALNAAIEAARAGEQGRGFAVVADEVRKLAERTTAATKEIAQMIKTIQSETQIAILAMQAGGEQVETGVQFTGRAGDALKQIIHMSEEVGEMIMHIATAATQQSRASEEIGRNTEQIATLVNESAGGARQAVVSCQGLSELALELQTMVRTFKLKTADPHSSALGRRNNQSSHGPGVRPGNAFAASAN